MKTKVANTVAGYMGRSCVRSESLGALPLDVIAEVAAALPMKKYVEIAKAAHPKQK